jgi:hypothetical protein
MSKKKKSRKNTQAKSTNVEVNEFKSENNEKMESKQETTKFVTSCLVVVLLLILVSSCFFLDKNMFTFASRETAQSNKGIQQSKIIEQWTDGKVISKCVYSVGFYEGTEPITLSGIENCNEATIIYNDDETKVEVKLGYENVVYREENVEPTEIEYQENVIETGEKHAAIKSIKVNDIDVPVSFFKEEYEWLDRLEYMVPIVSRYDNVLVYRIDPRYQLGGYDGVVADVEGNIIKEFTYEQELTYENNKLLIYSLENGQRVCDDVCTSLGNNLCGIDAEDTYMNTVTIDTVLAKELETKITTYSEMCTNLGE